jgi:membrane-associated protease RseP (regulator of RpoE activity)
VIVVATDDFELYHEAVAELRERGVSFTTVRPEDDLPEETRVVLSAPTDGLSVERAVHVVVGAGDARHGVEEALAALRSDDGRTVVGVDPGPRPGIAVLVGDVVVAAFHVPVADAVDAIRREVEDAPDALVRVGDGDRLQSAKLINELEAVRVEMVDETGTTPYLGTGARGMGDVLAAVNIARLEGEAVERREIDPTAGELQRIKNESRERSADNRTIDEALARRVASGELTVDEALEAHRERSDGTDGDSG